MIYRRFGRTEISMPVFSCGGMRYQHKWDDLPLSEVPPDNQSNLEATIRRSVEVGINHIETARGYGSSERQLGLILPQLPRDEIIVQTKIAPEADPSIFVKHFNESLDRMNLEHVDLLAIHGINTYEQYWQSIKPGGCLAAAREIQAQGKALHIGFSTHGAFDLVMDTVCHEGDGGFDYVNLHWYYIFQKNWPAVLAAKQRDMGLFIISPSDKGGMLYRPSEKLVELCDPLHPLVFNCLFCLRQSEVHTLSLGASTPSDFDLQLSSLPYLDEVDTLLPPIVERLDRAMHDAVGKEVAEKFAQGLPEWEDAPDYINMPVILWLRHLAMAYDMQEYGRMRYNLLGNGGHWFPGLNASNVERLDIAKAVSKSPYKDKIPGWLKESHEMLWSEPEKRLSES